jgi:hypothetical protein
MLLWCIFPRFWNSNKLISISSLRYQQVTTSTHLNMDSATLKCLLKTQSYPCSQIAKSNSWRYQISNRYICGKKKFKMKSFSKTLFKRTTRERILKLNIRTVISSKWFWVRKSVNTKRILHRIQNRITLLTITSFQNYWAEILKMKTLISTRERRFKNLLPANGKLHSYGGSNCFKFTWFCSWFHSCYPSSWTQTILQFLIWIH